ncbi:MAG: hypothetical protein ACFFDT_24935 [Candidatus Hodarchaeota archaeon]
MNPQIKKNRILQVLFICAVFFLISVVWATELRFDGLYVCIKHNKNYTNFLRFFQDGTVISAAIGGTTPESIKAAAKWLTWEKGMQGTYNISGSQIKFAISNARGSIEYIGIISGNTIDFKIHSNITNIDLNEKFEFIKLDVVPYKPAKKSERIMTEEENLELGEWITEIVYYDEYQRPIRSDLLNRKGIIVARRGRVFAATTLSQSFLASNGPLKPGSICDIDPNEVFFITNHDPQGNPITSRFLCLDKNGDLIMDGERPLLVNTFSASQKTETKIIYNGAFKQKAYIKIFPCDNCAKQTGNSKVVYVW